MHNHQACTTTRHASPPVPLFPSKQTCAPAHENTAIISRCCPAMSKRSPSYCQFVTPSHNLGEILLPCAKSGVVYLCGCRPQLQRARALVGSQEPTHPLLDTFSFPSLDTFSHPPLDAFSYLPASIFVNFCYPPPPPRSGRWCKMCRPILPPGIH